MVFIPQRQLLEYPVIQKVALFLFILAVILFVVRPLYCEELPWIEGSTSLAVLPDTERYSDDYPQYFEAQTAWIAESYRRRNIAYTIHLGDITQHNAPAEWKVARSCFDMLEGRVPYALAPGNHDYEGNAPERLTSRLSEYFPVSSIKKWPTFGGVFQEGRLENSFHLLRIGKRDWIILVLEMGPRNEVLAWANKILERHGERLGLLVTHAYLFRNNTRYDHRLGKQRASPHGWGNDGEELWQKLVRRHRNMMIVLSGHVSTGGLGYLASEGDYGNTVHQMMVDYEKMRGGGKAYMRLLEFLPDGKKVQVWTYSPSLKKKLSSTLEQFTFELLGPTRKKPRPVGRTLEAPLRRAPRHRYDFGGSGSDGAQIEDSIGKASGLLVANGTASALDGKGQLVLSGNGHVMLPPHLLAGLKDMSFEVWFTPTAHRYNWNSVVPDLGNNDGKRADWFTYVFRTLTVHRAEIAVDRHNEDIQQKVPLKPGTRLHVVLTYDHDASDGKPLLSYYRDGELAGAMRTGLSLGDVDDSASTLGPFEGQFDELRIYDYSLDSAEVRASFRAGSGKLRIAPKTEK